MREPAQLPAFIDAPAYTPRYRLHFAAESSLGLMNAASNIIRPDLRRILGEVLLLMLKGMLAAPGAFAVAMLLPIRRGRRGRTSASKR